MDSMLIKNVPKIKAVMLAAAVAASLFMLIIGVVLLLMDHERSHLPRIMPAFLLFLSPVPVTSGMFLVRAINRYATELEALATRDPLTELYNQRTFWNLLQYEIQRAKRQGYRFSLLLIDLDNFKVINDKYGHDVGDLYLKEFASTLRTAVRKGDIPARYESDNFAAILPVCDEEQAYVVAKRIIDAMRDRAVTLPDGLRIRETVSIGASVYPNHAEQPQDLFLLAERMLAQAKSAGKDHMAFPGAQDNIGLIRDLGESCILILEALHNRENKKLVPYFQPIVDVTDKSVLAYEVLTRIVMNDRVLPAAAFIEAAENMGAIGKIDYRLIEQAFAVVKERNYPGTLFLNLSPKAMVIRDFIPTILALFRDFGIRPETMVFEITERDTVKNLETIEGFVHKLRDEGFRFAIDDFGAGYSSFQYLRSFAVDYLKVDGEFIRNLHGSGTIEREIVSSIAGLANRLKIKTIAEYVETEGILGEVRSAGIHYAQGYYIKHPSPDLG
jgi:diguanylate cyclase (GGDEF)-like protein